MLSASHYGFVGFGTALLLSLGIAKVCQFGPIRRLFAYLSISSLTASLCCMFDITMLQVPNGPSRTESEMGQFWLMTKHVRDTMHGIDQIPDEVERAMRRSR